MLRFQAQSAQEPPSGVDAAAAIEKNLVDVIARTEKSVVAIARVRKEKAGETFRMEIRPDPFYCRPILPSVSLSVPILTSFPTSTARAW